MAAAAPNSLHSRPLPTHGKKEEFSAAAAAARLFSDKESSSLGREREGSRDRESDVATLVTLRYVALLYFFLAVVILLKNRLCIFTWASKMGSFGYGCT